MSPLLPHRLRGYQLCFSPSWKKPPVPRAPPNNRAAVPGNVVTICFCLGNCLDACVYSMQLLAQQALPNQAKNIIHWSLFRINQVKIIHFIQVLFRVLCDYDFIKDTLPISRLFWPLPLTIQLHELLIVTHALFCFNL
jgi:hypothetical protein